MSKEFLLDGEPITFVDLIRYAQNNYGCQIDEPITCSSVAAQCLRTHGHTVQDNTPENRKK